MDGVHAGIDAVGFQAVTGQLRTGRICGRWSATWPGSSTPLGTSASSACKAKQDLHPAAGGHEDGRLTVPWATFFAKGVSVGFGRTHDRRYTALLRDLILSGRARPGTIVTHHGRLDDAPALYREFGQRSGGVIRPSCNPRPADQHVSGARSGVRPP